MTIDRRSFFGVLAATGSAAAALPGEAAARERPEAPEDAVGLLYDATLCIGCQACVSACRRANDVPYDADDELHYTNVDLSNHARNVIKLFRDDGANGAPERRAFMKVQCMHCIDPGCASACMLGSFQKRIGGAVTWDPTKCVGCRYCQVACPFGIPKFAWDSATPELVKCELCSHLLEEGGEPACTEVCPREAVIFGRRDELLEEAHRRIAAEPERYQDRVYGETEAGGTQCLYLAPADVSFAELGLPDLPEQGIPHLPETLQHTIYKGFAAPTILYGLLGVTIWRNRREQAKRGEIEPDEPGPVGAADDPAGRSDGPGGAP